MATKDQEILDLDDPKVSQLIMDLQSLQKDINDHSRRFDELLKPFDQEEDAVKETLNDIDIDLARDSEFRLSTETLDPKIGQRIMHLISLQKDINDHSKRFNELLKPFVQEEDAVKKTLNDIDIDLASDSEFHLSTETLDPKISQLIMDLQSLQKDINDHSKRFNESVKPFVQDEDAVKETSNEFPKLSKDISDMNLGDGSFNPGPSSEDSENSEEENEELKKDDNMKRRFLAKVEKAFGNSSDDEVDDNCIEGLEQDLRGRIAARISQTFEKDRDEGKKSLMECIEEFDIDSEEFRKMILIKADAFEVGKKLSRLLVDLVFMMSGKEEFEAKIDGLRSALKWASTEVENSTVINKIVTVLEHAIILSEVTKENWNQGDDLCLLVHQFCNLALDLESIMSRPQLSKEQNLIYMALSTFECGLKQSEKKLNDLRKDVNKFQELFSFKLHDMDDVMEKMIAKSWKFE